MSVCVVTILSNLLLGLFLCFGGVCTSINEQQQEFYEALTSDKVNVCWSLQAALKGSRASRPGSYGYRPTLVVIFRLVSASELSSFRLLIAALHFLPSI